MQSRSASSANKGWLISGHPSPLCTIASGGLGEAENFSRRAIFLFFTVLKISIGVRTSVVF